MKRESEGTRKGKRREVGKRILALKEVG